MGKWRSFTPAAVASPLSSSTPVALSPTSDSKIAWKPLGVSRSDLSLSLTLPTGQSFRWRRTAPDQFTGVVGPHLVSLSYHGGGYGVAFHLHGPSTSSAAAAARAAINDYFNLSVPLGELWAGFAGADARFAELARSFEGGARVLRQDPVECLLQFLCSSNNNIARIEKMVEVLSSHGEYLGSIAGFDFHVFPSLERLGALTELELREAGFGYRAKYIVGAVRALNEKPDGGAKWLASLRRLELSEVVDCLCTLPGVGPKVAACIALFSLDQHHAIPVDTHVWQIATQYLLPELAGSRLNSKLCIHVAEAFVNKFGKYAGWAQNVFFIAELPSQKKLQVSAKNSHKSVKRKILLDVIDDDPIERKN